MRKIILPSTLVFSPTTKLGLESTSEEIQEFEIDTPKNPFIFPYTTLNRPLTFSTVSSLFDTEILKKIKSKEIDVNQWKVIKDKIKILENSIGNGSQPLHKMINHPKTGVHFANVLKEMEYDSIRIDLDGDINWAIIN